LPIDCRLVAGKSEERWKEWIAAITKKDVLKLAFRNTLVTI